MVANPKLRVGSQRCKPLMVFYVERVPAIDRLSTALPTSRLADFLVIGAMKAGTTTLYHDLRSQPDVVLPDKESNALLDIDARARYQTFFKSAADGQRCGEVCPDYSKPGLDEEAASRAKLLYAGHEPPKLIYLVREPIARLLSHHYFVSSQHGDANPGGMTRDLEKSLSDFPELIDTSRYAARLQPWLDAFGGEQIRVVRFEEYIAKRTTVLGELAGFLGMANFSAQNIQQDRVHNSSTNRPVATPFWRRIMHHPLYRNCLRPLLSLEMRDRLRHRLLPRPPSRPEAPAQATITQLVDELQPEVAAISKIAGCRDGEMLWNLHDLYTGSDADAKGDQQ